MKQIIGFLALIAIAPSVAPAQQASTRLVAMSNSPADSARDEAIAKLERFLTRYPASELRPNALFQLSELLIRKADEEFAETQRAVGADSAGRADAPIRPNYEPAVVRLEELVRRFPSFSKVDASAYTLGTLYFSAQRYADASTFEKPGYRRTSSSRRATAGS